MTARKIVDARHCESGLTERSVMPPATMPTSSAPRTPAPPCNANMPTLTPTKNGNGIDRQREDQPAEQADASGVEQKSKGEHGGGSICKEGTVAPSTTTAAQFWT